MKAVRAGRESEPWSIARSLEWIVRGYLYQGFEKIEQNDRGTVNHVRLLFQLRVHRLVRIARALEWSCCGQGP